MQEPNESKAEALGLTAKEVAEAMQKVAQELAKDENAHRSFFDGGRKPVSWRRNFGKKTRKGRTKNKSQGTPKAQRRQAKKSQRINRQRLK